MPRPDLVLLLLQAILDKQRALSAEQLRAVQEKYDVVKAVSVALERKLVDLARERDYFKEQMERAVALEQVRLRKQWSSPPPPALRLSPILPHDSLVPPACVRARVAERSSGAGKMSVQ